jgi:hypothetical protein
MTEIKPNYDALANCTRAYLSFINGKTRLGIVGEVIKKEEI